MVTMPAEYLTDLRSNRIARPNGSRPLPATSRLSGKTVTSTPEQQNDQSLNSPPSSGRPATNLSATTSSSCVPGRAFSTRRTSPSRSYSTIPEATKGYGNKGRPLVRAPGVVDMGGEPSSTRELPRPRMTGSFIDSGQRWMERQEARSLTAALNDMDLQEETRLHAAALEEASELVWRHQNPNTPYRYARPAQQYKEHLEKDSYARYRNAVDRPAHGVEPEPPLVNQVGANGRARLPKGLAAVTPMSPHLGSAKGFTRASEVPSTTDLKVHGQWDSPQKKAYMRLCGIAPAAAPQPRKTSGARRRKASGTTPGLFTDPDDRIYEEPRIDDRGSSPAKLQQTPTAGPLQAKPRNAVNIPTFGFSKEQTHLLAASGRKPVIDTHRRVSPQTRPASYIINRPAATPPSAKRHSHAGSSPLADDGDGIEVRSKDIVDATTMRLKDRSPKLPTPAFVSDRPNRPIVSFDKSWKPAERNSHDEKQESPPAAFNSLPAAGTFTRTRGASASPRPHESHPSSCVPKIALRSSRDIPTITVDAEPGPAIPTITVAGEDTTATATKSPQAALPGPKPRPLPQPRSHGLQSASAGARGNWGQHFNPFAPRPVASCTRCGLAIVGRTVSAAGERFHPECFTCYHCGEGLECVAFYPEPDAKRAERLLGSSAGVNDGCGDGSGYPPQGPGSDEPLRFYCHLDFHELFSPRCRSCKTPIEGEVVLACGGEWHVGHFFCAQCGDPFESSTPFVEKDGYAWCVGCHTNRFSPKCKKCRKPVVDTVLKALGGEWHPDCFCCTTCGGSFDDGRYFLRHGSEQPVCVRCEEMRLKA